MSDLLSQFGVLPGAFGLPPAGSSGGGGGGTFPGSSTDNALVRFDGTGGSTVQNSTVTASDAGLFNWTATSDGQIYLQFNPLYASYNEAATFSIQETANPAGGERNMVMVWGHNTNASGGRINTAKGQMLIHLESNYQATTTSRVQEMLFTILSREVGRAGNRVLAFYAEDHTSNGSYGTVLAESSVSSWKYLYSDTHANIGTSWVEETPGARAHYDRPDNTQFLWEMSASGITFSTANITGGAARRDFIFTVGGASSRFSVSDFYIDPTAARINLGFATNAFTCAGTLTIAGANLALDNNQGIYLKSSGGTQFQVISMDGSNNLSLRNELAANSSTYYGNSSTSNNTGSVFFQTDGANRLEIKSNGQFVFTPDGSTTVLTVDANGIGFYSTAGQAKPTVSGSRGANAALASLLTALAGLGLLTDSSSA